MLVGTRYGFQYIHKRKEVILRLQIGSTPPFEVVMAAEAFCQDLDYIINDKALPKYFDMIKERKDLPVDYDFGAGGGDKSFDPKEWEDKMGGSDATA